MSDELERKIKDAMLATEAAALSVARNEKITIKMGLTLYDLEAKEQPHGSQTFLLIWVVPLIGRTELSRKIVPTQFAKKCLKKETGVVLNAYVKCNLIDARHQFPIVEEVGSINDAYPKKDSDTLSLFDFAGDQWTLNFKFASSGVLEQVDFVHDSDEHSQLTTYLLEVAKQRKIEALPVSKICGAF